MVARRASTVTRRATMLARRATPVARRAEAVAAGQLLVALVAALVATTGAGEAATYSGTLAQAGVVWISDDSKPAPRSDFEMRNTHKAFAPSLLVVAAGSAVRFPNDDAFFHSIYSEGPPDPFDIGFYDTGPGKSVVFAHPGVVVVRCHIHGPMHGTIVVVDGPSATTTEPNAKYSLDVRSGNHVLHVWTADGGEKTTQVKI